MEKIGELVKKHNGNLTRQNDATTTTALSVSEPLEPRWADLVEKLAQDLRQDLAPGILTLWKEKLRNYSDREICEGLMSQNWLLFPSVFNLADVLDQRREERYGDKADIEWRSWKATQAQAEVEGRMATDEDYAELRKTFQEIIAKPMSKERAEQIKQGFAEAKNVSNQTSIDGRVSADADKLGLEKSTTEGIPIPSATVCDGSKTSEIADDEAFGTCTKVGMVTEAK